MTDQQNRPQSLLEAAKTLASHLSLVVAWPKDRDYQNLLAAIAREEAKPSDFWQSCLDRAQQAEADAKWHKAESERLSQALAEAKKSVAYLANRACDTIPVDTSGHWQQRAEDAEAKVRNLQRQNRDAIDERDLFRLRTATIDNLRQRAEKAEAESERLGAELARAKESAAHLEKLRVEANELASYWARNYRERDQQAEAKAKSHPMDGGDITVMLNRAGVASAAGWSLTQRIEWLVGEWKAERALKESFRRDSQGVRTDMRAWNHRLGEVVPVADNPIDTVRAVIAEVHDLRCKVALAKEALGVKS